MIPSIFNPAHILDGEKMAKVFFRTLDKEDPRVGLVALAMCTVVTLRATKVSLGDYANMLRHLGTAISHIHGAAQEALSSIILPG